MANKYFATNKYLASCPECNRPDGKRKAHKHSEGRMAIPSTHQMERASIYPFWHEVERSLTPHCEIRYTCSCEAGGHGKCREHILMADAMFMGGWDVCPFPVTVSEGDYELFDGDEIEPEEDDLIGAHIPNEADLAAGEEADAAAWYSPCLACGRVECDGDCEVRAAKERDERTVAATQEWAATQATERKSQPRKPTLEEIFAY